MTAVSAKKVIIIALLHLLPYAIVVVPSMGLVAGLWEPLGRRISMHATRIKTKGVLIVAIKADETMAGVRDYK